MTTFSAPGILTIDLGALADNYRLMQQRAPGAEVMAAVKADAYGLGIEQVAPALWQAGCRGFFIAHMAEGVRLRALLPDADIFVLDGLMPGDEADCVAHRLTPVLNDPGQVACWADHLRARDQVHKGVVHVDTGIHRLGLTLPEWEAFCADPPLQPDMVMSHLACASQPDHPRNAEQLAAFKKCAATTPDARASLANSAGVFLGPAYHFDVARAGIALYGAEPVAGQTHGVKPVVSLKVRILREHMVQPGESVGYDARFVAERPTRIATIEAGYADGLATVFTNRGQAWIGGHAAPLVGRVSMDLITLDVTDVPPALTGPGQSVEMLGVDQSVEALAAQGGLISYEILTGLGRRFARRYIP